MKDVWRFKKVNDMWVPKVIIGDIREVAPKLPNNFIDCIITSPPYWKQRDYGHPKQIGREPTPEQYVKGIVEVFRKLRPKLKKTGVIFLNIGYKYLKEELLLIPEMIALEMRKIGYILKNKIIWYKPNAMPTPARNRLNNVYEPVLVFIKEEGKEVYYFNINEVAKKPKTLLDYVNLLSIKPKDLLGARVTDSLRTRASKEGVVIGVKYHSNEPLEVIVKWQDNVVEDIKFGNPLKNYPEEILFKCPICDGTLTYWDINLSFANNDMLICPYCDKVLCLSKDTFPIPLYPKDKSINELRTILLENNVHAKEYITQQPKSSKFKKVEILTASPAGRLAIQGEKIIIKRRWRIPQPLICGYLRYWRKMRGATIDEIDRRLGYSYTAGHWFRRDFNWWGKGGSIPRPNDWIRLKQLLNFDDRYDRLVTEVITILETVKPHEKGKNPGDVWSIRLEQYPEAHFAIFPRELVRRCLLIGCPPNGVVLDPFAGSGTVGEVVMKLGRKAILVELIPEYLKLIRKRCDIIEVLDTTKL